MLYMSPYEFSQNSTSCDIAREFKSVQIVSRKSEKYNSAIAMLDIFRAILWDKSHTLDDLMQLCAEKNGYELQLAETEGSFEAEDETLKLHTQKDAFHYGRYLKEELAKKRENLVYTKDLPELEIRIGNIAVRTKPQALFAGRHSLTGDYAVEAVFYKDGKKNTGRYTLLQEIEQYDKKNPGIPENDRYRLKSVGKWTYPYVALKYIEELVSDEDWLEVLKIPKGARVLACGSEYHMTASSGDAEATEFSTATGTVVSLNEEYTAGALNRDVKTDLDQVFFLYAERQELGHPADECSEEDCRWCLNSASCKFQKDPVKKERIGASGTENCSFVPTTAQEKMISLREGYNLCIARAGAGKTASMVGLVTGLLDEGVPLKKILMATFTNNAVNDFRERVRRELVKNDPEASIEGNSFMTLHGLALDVVKNNYEDVGYTAPPREINDTDKGREVEYLLSDKKIPGTSDLYKYNFEGVLNVVDIAISIFDYIAEHPQVLDDPDRYRILEGSLRNNKRGMLDNGTLPALCDLYDEYIKQLKEINVILYGQMEPMMHEILALHPGYMECYGFEYVILDEWQDSSLLEMETVKALAACPSVKMIIAVGDDGQSIYDFRGAVVDNITEFEQKLGRPVNKIEMLENWRSTPEILALADDLIALNVNRTEGRTIAGRGSLGIEPDIRGFYSEEEEYQFILDMIRKNYEAGIPYEEQAFIARKGKELLGMMRKLAKEGIPYVLKNPLKFADNSRVKAAIAFTMNIFWEPETSAGLFALLAARYNGEMLERLSPGQVQEELGLLKEEYAYFSDKDLELQKVLYHKALDSIRGEDEIYNAFLDEYLYTYPDLEDELQFIVDFQKYGKGMSRKMAQDYEGVVLVTAHSAKGLEWKVVYNSISEYDSTFLHAGKRHDEVEETRRLLYVSMTRAKNILYVTGQYVVPGTKSVAKKAGGPTYNQFLEELMMLRGIPYVPDDPKAAEKKAARRTKANASAGKSGSREMTEEEIKEYNRRTLGSYQQTFGMKALPI